MKTIITAIMAVIMTATVAQASLESKNWPASDKAKKFVKDTVVIGFFAFALSVAHALVMPGEGIGFSFIWHLFQEVGGSILLGLAIGVIIILYLRFV